MENVIQLKASAPRIRVVNPPIMGDRTLDWFAAEFVGLIFQIQGVENYRHWNGELLETYKVSKASAYRQLCRKSTIAADFLRSSPAFYEDCLYINADACAFLDLSGDSACNILCF